MSDPTGRCLQVRKVRRGGATLSPAWMLAAAAMVAVASPAAAQPAIAARRAVQFALIVNGDDSFTHNLNVSLALATLPRLGYAPENTLVLAPDGDRRGPAVWRQGATGGSIAAALAVLRGRMREGDLLLVYLTGHAYRSFGRVVLGLQSGSIGAAELLRRVGELPFGKLILVADPCYSGGFVKAAMTLGRDVVAVASTDDRHEVRCEPFVRPFWMAAAAAADAGDIGAKGEGRDAARSASVSIEKAFHSVVAGLHRLSDDGPPQYAASGACAGRDNTFAATPAAAVAASPPVSPPRLAPPIQFPAAAAGGR
jgi:hypothetical protein